MAGDLADPVLEALRAIAPSAADDIERIRALKKVTRNKPGTEDDTPFDTGLLANFTYEGRHLTAKEAATVISFLSHGFPTIWKTQRDVKSTTEMFTPAVLAALHELTKDALNQFQINPNKVVRALGAIMDGNIADVCDINAQGISVKDFSKLPRRVTAAVKEIQETRNAQGTTLRIQMHDPQVAINALARILGMNQDKLTVDVSMDLTERLDRALARVEPKPMDIEGELVVEKRE